MTSKELIEKVLNDDVESEALEYLSNEINKELKKPLSEINFDTKQAIIICNQDIMTQAFADL